MASSPAEDQGAKQKNCFVYEYFLKRSSIAQTPCPKCGNFLGCPLSTSDSKGVKNALFYSLPKMSVGGLRVFEVYLVGQVLYVVEIQVNFAASCRRCEKAQAEFFHTSFIHLDFLYRYTLLQKLRMSFLKIYPEAPYAITAVPLFCRFVNTKSLRHKEKSGSGKRFVTRKRRKQSPTGYNLVGTKIKTDRG